ncbi:MAG: OmpA family protein [Hyphomicrobiaceae bacterium]
MKRIDIRTPDAWRSFDFWKFMIALVFPLVLTGAWYSRQAPPMSACCGTGVAATAATPIAPVAAPAALVAPEVEFATAGGKVTLRGKIASQETREVLAGEARQVFGAENVVDKLEVVAGRGPLAWIGSAKNVIGELRDMPAPASVIAGASVVTLSGIVESQGEKDIRGDRARQLFGKNVTIANGIAVRPPAPVSPILTPVSGANGMLRYTLPGGKEIEVAKDGLEAKLLGFITDKSAAIDNKLWFDFDRLSFDTASSNLTAQSKAQIATAAAILKAYPAVVIKIGGYTDNQGDADANLKLSDARAKRVMDEIVADGVASDRFESKGYGEEHPIGDNATAEGRAKNRRTSLSVRAK